MHRVIKTHSRRSELHPADGGGGLQFSGGWQNDGSRNSMIREVPGVMHAVARFITDLFGSRIYARTHQRMESFDSIPDSLFSMDRVVFYPVALALEGIS